MTRFVTVSFPSMTPERGLGLGLPRSANFSSDMIASHRMRGAGPSIKRECFRHQRPAGALIGRPQSRERTGSSSECTKTRR
jgi:hypothetical protein